MQEVTTNLRDTAVNWLRRNSGYSRQPISLPGTKSWRQNRYSCKPSRFHSGAVVKPGDAIMDLVPENDRLVVEVNAQSNVGPVVCYTISADAEAYRGSHGRRASAGASPRVPTDWPGPS
jgi:hypothetical protein